MSARDIVQRVAAAYATGHTKMAAFPPFPPKDGPPAGPPGASGSQKRNIPQDHPFDAQALKPMAKALWAASVSLGHALTAYRHVNRLKSTTVSPDGMVGGRGYIMPVKDLRQKLYEACEALSAITDTLHDEIQAPHWKPKLAQLDQNDAEDISRFIEESQGLLDNPEEEAENEIEKIEGENDGKGDKESPVKPDDTASEIPGGGPADASQAQPPQPNMKQASAGWGYIPWRPMTMDDDLRGRTEHLAMVDDISVWPKEADSSVPPDSLPGPRVDDLDRGDQTGPWGSFNKDETPSDDWTQVQKPYIYPSERENDFHQAGSSLPSDDDTPTDAWDFGLGYGARGDGAGGYQNPSDEGNGKGVWGPHSKLPSAPPTSVNDTTPVVDVSLNERKALFAELPGDTDDPVARSDYFKGWKGNLVQSESELPGEATPRVDNPPSMMNTDYVTEDVETPYVRYDYTTHTYREDPLHNWPQEKLPQG